MPKDGLDSTGFLALSVQNGRRQVPDGVKPERLNLRGLALLLWHKHVSYLNIHNTLIIYRINKYLILYLSLAFKNQSLLDMPYPDIIL